VEKEEGGVTVKKEEGGVTVKKEEGGVTVEKEEGGVTMKKEEGGVTVKKEETRMSNMIKSISSFSNGASTRDDRLNTITEDSDQVMAEVE